MRPQTEDKTLEKKFIQRAVFLIQEYELTKEKRHGRFRTVNEFYTYYQLCRQNFLKYYNRYNQRREAKELLPRKRGPKWRTRRPHPMIEQKVIAERLKGSNRYEIHAILKPFLKRYTPSPSGIYTILKRENLNRLNPPMKVTKRKIIKQRAGELGHIDCHYLDKGLITGHWKRFYLVCVLDDFSRVAWAKWLKMLKV